MTTWTGLARLAFVAEQFGYEYADVWQTGGYKYLLVVVPDPSPQARERAAQNWARYPDASDGVSLPPLVPDAIELLKARMTFDWGRQLTAKQWVAIAGSVITVFAAAIGYRFADNTADVAVVAKRRNEAKSVAQLEAAGFTPVTDRSGRLRYVPPGRQLPGHGNPFAGRA